ncbi:MAG: type II toxin-antitoxin system prevent-host-death family antitoxin [Sulfuricella sp.]
MDAIFAEHTIGVTELRESPSRVLRQAEETDEAVAILNHNRPAGYIVSPRMMAAMLDAIADRVAEDRAKSRLSSLSLARKITLDDL